jgi:hypothetical protein
VLDAASTQSVNFPRNVIVSGIVAEYDSAMRGRVHGLALGLALASTFAVAPASAATPSPEEPAKARYFYHGYDYGSQALFNPIYVLLNRGFDVLQLRPFRRNIWNHSYLRNGKNVWGSVSDPFVAIHDRGGMGKFLRQEIFPLSFTDTTARWLPNYGLHLIGGGMTFTELREWFEDHDAPGPVAPAFFSIVTLFTAAIVNETLENNEAVGPNTDCIADLMVFDVAGVLLFSIPQVNEFFSKTLILSDWSLQPAFILPKGEIHNQGNYYAVKWPLPFYERLRLFGYMGFGDLGGLSFKLDAQTSISAGAGVRVATLQNAELNALENVIGVKRSGAVFIDRNESLLASVQVSDVRDYFFQANLYPNAFFRTKQGLGFFAVVSRDGHAIGGVSFAHGLGFGLGAGNF